MAPRARPLSLPAPPASSRASRAADLCGAFPLAGQPFGMIQRPVSREVTSKTSVGDLPFRRYGKAAYWTHFAPGFFLDSTMTANATTHEHSKKLSKPIFVASKACAARRRSSQVLPQLVE